MQFDIHSLPSSSWQTVNLEASTPPSASAGAGATFELGSPPISEPSDSDPKKPSSTVEHSDSGGKTLDLNAPLSLDADFSLAPPGVASPPGGQTVALDAPASGADSGKTVAFDSVADFRPAGSGGQDSGQTMVLEESSSSDQSESANAGHASATLDIDAINASVARSFPDAPQLEEQRAGRTMMLSDVSSLSDLASPGSSGPDAVAMAGRTFVLADEVVEKIAHDTLEGFQHPRGGSTAELPGVPPRAQSTPAGGTIALDDLSGEDSADSSAASRAGTEPNIGPQKHHLPVRRSGLVVRTRSLRKPQDQVTREGDYELLKILGEGGMGVVYTARQSSIHRTVAIKMIKPGSKVDDIQKQKFLAEAVVTGDLEHPNIVPIYDLGTNEQGSLFYSMKKVQGTPWDKSVKGKTLPENVEILMKVADAIAFAHSKGVIHRDLKPENVMIGEFGEVLVMDWGLAISIGKLKEAGLRQALNMGGTPAYMAPEMVTGPFDRIGAHSDIYLLGAILFEIVTGDPPHTGATPMKCLHAAARNEIRTTEKTGELVDVARRAMATKPNERYASVRDFQTAIREYQSHAESIFLTTRAEGDFQKAQSEGTYDRFARAVFGFQEALVLWPGNSRARQLLSEAQLGYARSALNKGDYDLGLSVIDDRLEPHRQVGTDLQSAKQERESRRQRLKTLRRLAISGTALFVLVVVGAFFWIKAEKDLAEDRRVIAVKAQEEAEAARGKETEARKQEEIARKEAESRRQQAVDAQALAETKRKEAVAAQKQEADARTREEYAAYIAQIGLAAAKIEENEFESARTLLDVCKPALRNWEWGRLKHLCSQDLSTSDAPARLDAVAFANDGSFFVTGGWSGSAQVWRPGADHPFMTLPLGSKAYVHSVAVSPDNSIVATVGSDRSQKIRLWNAANGQPIDRVFPGHTDAVLSVAFSPDGKILLTSSYDKTARLWDVATGKPLGKPLTGHTWWVWQAAFSADGKQIVTVSQDGTALVWSSSTGDWSDSGKIIKSPPFAGHQGPVYSAAFSPDGSSIVTSGYDKRVLLWKPAELKKVDFAALARNENAVPASPYTAFDGHMDAVRAVSFSPDGRLCLSGAHDNTVKAWDVATGKVVKTFRGHNSWVRGCRFSPDGEKIVSVGYDNKVKLWSVSAYGEERVLRGYVLQGHTDAILAAAFSPDEKKIVTASRDNSARLWDVRSGRELQQFQEGHMYLVSQAQFSRDGKQLFTSAVDSTVRQWDIASGTQLRRFDQTGRSAVMAVSPEGTLLVTGSSGNSALLWALGSEGDARELAGHRGAVTAAVFSEDGRRFVTGDAEGRCLVWDSATAKLLFKFGGHTRRITALAFVPAKAGSEPRILSASGDNTVANWDPRTGKEDPRLVLKHPDEVLDVALLANGQAVTACKDQQVRVWDLATARITATIQPGSDNIHDVAAAPDGKRFLTIDPVSRRIRVWDSESRKEILYPVSGKPGSTASFFPPETKAGPVWSATFSPDGNSIVTVGGREARLWDSRIGRELMNFTPHGTVASANFSPDGQRFVTGFWDNSARVWSLDPRLPGLRLGGRSGELNQSHGHSGFVNTACFSPDGKTILTASEDRTAKLWNAATGEWIRTFEGHGNRVRSAVFSADGSQVLTASSDKTARIWDAATGKLVQEFSGHRHGLLCAVFSMDGTRVATGSDDNSARIWNAATGESLSVLKGHTAAVTSVAFSRDGHRLLTGSQDFLTKLWDADTRKEILTLKGHTQEVTSVSFAPHGRYALTGSRDGTAIIWLASDWQMNTPALRAKQARIEADRN